MAAYTENDIQNIFTDIYNGDTIATTATHHGVPRTTLCDRLKGTRSCRNAHNDKQRLSTI